MPKTGASQVNIGLGIESLAAPGVAVAESIFIPWTEFSLQGVSEKSMFSSIRGLRNQSSNSMIKRKYSQGSITVIPNVEVAPYFFSLALGGVATTGPVDSAYEHTFTVQNANATVRTATVTAEQGSVETAQYTNIVCDQLSLEVSDDYASMTAELIGQFPATDTITDVYTVETEFAYHQMTVKFGTSVANAASGSATPLKSFSLNIANNVQLDEGFLSGANEIVNGGLVFGRLQITGSYSLHFENTTELAKYRENTKNAAVIQFIGATIGTGESEEIRIDLGKLILTGPPIEYNVDGLIVLTQEFEVEYDATDVEITIIVTNEQSNAGPAIYNLA